MSQAPPLLDLHRHLDGYVRTETIIDLARQHDLPLPAWTPEQLRPFVVIDDAEPGLMAFLERFEYLALVLADLDACRRVALENVLDAATEGLSYVELRFSPWFMALRHELPVEGVVDAVLDGIADGVERTGLQAVPIGILSRTFGPETCQRELDALLRRSADLVAVDLAGDEAGYPAGLFKDHFAQVRDAGLAVTVHAGEADGAHSIWSAIRDLGATRIGHGIAAVDDPELIEHLIAERIGLEVCLTSNRHTSTVPDLANHP